MKWIVITTPDFIENEVYYIHTLFEAGIDLLHLRKPNSSRKEYEQLLLKIAPQWYKQIVIHEHFELCEKYHLHGIHLNKRNHEIPTQFKGSLSCSCHTFEEVKAATKYDYVFLSPIFDSISKEGYTHSFSNKDLEEASTNGIINSKVIALGGVTSIYIPQIRAWNFGGAAFLGDIWKSRDEKTWTKYLAQIKQLLIPQISKNSLLGSNVW